MVQGTLQVLLISAKKLNDGDFFGTLDGLLVCFSFQLIFVSPFDF
jgi:hypothetical protein